MASRLGDAAHKLVVATAVLTTGAMLVTTTRQALTIVNRKRERDREAAEAAAPAAAAAAAAAAATPSKPAE